MGTDTPNETPVTRRGDDPWAHDLDMSAAHFLRAGKVLPSVLCQVAAGIHRLAAASEAALAFERARHADQVDLDERRLEEQVAATEAMQKLAIDQGRAVSCMVDK